MLQIVGGSCRSRWRVARLARAVGVVLLTALLFLPMWVSAKDLTLHELAAQFAAALGTTPELLTAGLTEAEAAELIEVGASALGYDAPGNTSPLTVGPAAERESRSMGLVCRNKRSARCVGPAAEPEFRSMGRDLEAKIRDNLAYGQIFDAFYASPWRVDGVEVKGLPVIARGGHGHSTVWTGHYLAAEAFRYAVAKHNRDIAFNHGQAVVWQIEMKRAKERIDAMIVALHRNANISKNWSNPAYGIPGAPGILMRNTIPVDDPLGDGVRSGEQIYGPIPFDDGKQYLIEANTTRDQYTGAVFGWMLAFDLVGPDDASLRAQIRDDIWTILDYLLAHGWDVHQPYGTSTDPTPAPPKYLYVFNPSGQLQLTQAARHIAQTIGTKADRAKWEAVWSASLSWSRGELTAAEAALLELPSYMIGWPRLRVENYVGMLEPHLSYYSMNLDHLRFFDYTSREPNPWLRKWFKATFSILDTTTKDDENAHFEAITYTQSGEASRLNLAVQHLRQWLQYWGRWGQAIDLNPQCGITLQCVPEDTVYLEQKIDDVWVLVGTISGKSSRMRSTRVLRIADERHHEDFLWQRSPFGGSQGLARAATPLERPPTVDYLVTYWMLRYYTEVVTPPSHGGWPEFYQRTR